LTSSKKDLRKKWEKKRKKGSEEARQSTFWRKRRDAGRRTANTGGGKPQQGPPCMNIEWQPYARGEDEIGQANATFRKARRSCPGSPIGLRNLREGKETKRGFEKEKIM